MIWLQIDLTDKLCRFELTEQTIGLISTVAFMPIMLVSRCSRLLLCKLSSGNTLPILLHSKVCLQALWILCMWKKVI